jgi:hypothetical protein
MREEAMGLEKFILHDGPPTPTATCISGTR